MVKSLNRDCILVQSPERVVEESRMKKYGRICLAVLFAMLLLTAAGIAAPASVQAGTPAGLVKKGNTYYFYHKGKKVKNKWKSVTIDGQKQKLYFGKKGAAYRAGSLFENAYNVKLFKIKKKQYGFDMNSFLVKKGVYVNGSYKIMAFKKNGEYDKKKTKTLRGKLKIGKISKKMYDTVTSALGKPRSVSRSDSCSPWNEKDSFTDVVLNYGHFEVQLIQNDRTGEYMLDGYFPK